MYEVNNTGGWYDFGFLLGAAILLGQGGVRGRVGWRCRARSWKDAEWDEIGAKVEEKVRRGIRSWVEEEEKEDDWDEIGRKIEEKIKRELRNWGEK